MYADTAISQGEKAWKVSIKPLSQYVAICPFPYELKQKIIINELPKQFLFGTVSRLHDISCIHDYGQDLVLRCFIILKHEEQIAKSDENKNINQ